MANSRAGQYHIEYQLDGFTAPTRSHKLRMWVLPSGAPTVGTAPIAVTLMKKGGSTASLQAVADQAWSYFRLLYATSVNASSFSLWYWPTNTARDFITGGSLATPAGNGGGTISAAYQVTLSFRHALSGIGKLVFLETNTAGSTLTALVPNAAGTPTQRIAAYIMSADSPMVALDNSFPISPLRQGLGENEAIFRKIYRSL